MHPVLFHIGNFPVHSFGVMIVIAFAAGMALAVYRGPKYNVDRSAIQDAGFWALIAGIFGARIVYLALNWKDYAGNWREILSLRFQGLTSFGGFGFGAIAVLLFARIKKLPVLRLLDVAGPAFILGHAIGRIGCLLNGCCFGGASPTWVPWAISVQGSPFVHHPAQVYDALMNLVVLGVLLGLEARKSFWPGQILALTLALHACTRIIYEFWRVGSLEQFEQGVVSARYLPGLPVSEAQAFSALLLVLSITMYISFGRGSKTNVEAAPG